MMKIAILSLMITSGCLLHAQEESDSDLKMVNEFVARAEAQEYNLIGKEKCDRPPGEMCRWPYEITPDIHSLNIVVIGSEKSKPSFAVEDAHAESVITFSKEEDVVSDGSINFVRKTFSLKDSRLNVTFYFGNTRSYATESTYMLIFSK